MATIPGQTYPPARAAVAQLAETSPEAAHALALIDAGAGDDAIRAANTAAVEAVCPLDFGPNYRANAAVRVFIEEAFRLAATPLPQ